MKNFKGVYAIERWKGKRTWFHRKYYVFDGIGVIFFDTLVEARGYVVIKSGQLEHLYSMSKTIYKKLSDCYFDKLIQFRMYDRDNNLINSLLSDCLDSFKFLSREFFPQYAIGKLRYIYNCFLRIATILKMRVLYKTIESIKKSFYTPYPRFDSSKKVVVKQLNNNQLNTNICVG